MAFTYDEVASAMAAATPSLESSSESSSWFMSLWQCYRCAVEAAAHNGGADSSSGHDHRRRPPLWVRTAELIISSDRAERCFGPRARVRVVVEVGEVRRGESLTLERVMGVLAAAAAEEETSGVVVGCRHVRFGDPRTFRTRPWNLSDAGGCGNGQIECLERSCHMFARLFCKRLFRDTAPDEPVVELEIIRHLGYMKSPSSERWLAQIEEG